MLRSITLISFFVASFFALSAGSERAAAQQVDQRRPIAITRVTVIDMATGERRPLQTVIVRGSRIIEAGATSEVPVVPRGALVIDGRGKFLIPGLWDMHVHTAERAGTAFPLLLAHGVTGVRDMHLALTSATARAVALRDDVTTNRMLGPRMVVGTIVAGPDGARTEPTLLTAATPEEGRAVVRAEKAQRADFVKVRGMLGRATYFAILDEAKRVGIPVDGHVSFSLGAGEASDSGQRSIDHLEDGGVLAGCTASDSLLRAEILAAQAAPMSPQRRSKVIAVFRRMSDAIDENSCMALGRRLARNGTAFTPTLTVERLVLNKFDVPPLGEDERPYVPRAMQQWLNRSLGSLQRDTGAVWQRHFKQQLKIVPIMQRAGVTLLAGTDLGPQGYLTPGFSLHQELGLLVQAGLTPLQALQAATINPARALRATDSLGTVSAGKLADLVLLDADPTIDVANARRVRAVVANGRLLDREALDAMLREASRTIGSEPLSAPAPR